MQLRLRLLALLLPLLPLPARAPKPSAQDMSLGVVSAGSAGSCGLQFLGVYSEIERGKPGPDSWVLRKQGQDSNIQRVTEDGFWAPGFLVCGEVWGWDLELWKGAEVRS